MPRHPDLAEDNEEANSSLSDRTTTVGANADDHERQTTGNPEKTDLHRNDSERSNVATPANEPPPPAAWTPPPVPDGGWEAWLQVAGAFMLFFNTWGILNTFGIFQTYYESGTLFTESPSNIAWIGALQAFILLFLGSLTGPIFDRGYLRTLVAIGAFSTVLGYMMLSLCKTFWQAVLAQGFLIGIGGGCLFTPGIAVLPGYFRKNLGLAVGLAASGSSLGGVIYPIVFYRLIDQIGFGWTTRVLGFMALGTLLLPLVVMKQRIKPAKARALIDWTAFNDTPYVLFVIACFFGFSSLYTVLFYLSYFGAATGIADNKMSFYIVPILNAASVFGRTLPNWISDTTGPMNILVPAAFICCILIFSMIAVKSLAGFIVQAVLLGFFTGVFIALPPVIFAQLTKDKTKIGTRIGMGFSFLSFATLLGGPGTGGILGNDPNNLHWRSIWIYGGVLELTGACIYCFIRIWMSNWKLTIKI